jgi:hypothetical protein
MPRRRARLGAFETTNISVGRGTDTPFQQIGAVDRRPASLRAQRAADPGVRFYLLHPSSDRCDQEYRNVPVITDRAALRPCGSRGDRVALWLSRTISDRLGAALFGSTDDRASRPRISRDRHHVAADEARWRLLRANICYAEVGRS